MRNDNRDSIVDVNRYFEERSKLKIQLMKVNEKIRDNLKSIGFTDDLINSIIYSDYGDYSCIWSPLNKLDEEES